MYVHAAKGKRIELSTQNSVDIQCMGVTRQALKSITEMTCFVLGRTLSIYSMSLLVSVAVWPLEVAKIAIKPSPALL